MKRIVILILLTFVFLFSGCSNGSSPLPETQIIAEEPILIGYITEINDEDQMLRVVENISKEKALKGEFPKHEGSWLQLNISKIDGKLEVGNKVAIWDSPLNESESKPERKVLAISRHIVLLEK